MADAASLVLDGVFLARRGTGVGTAAALACVRTIVTLALAFLLPATPARAADVALRYLVERTPLRAASPATPVTLELHADAACSAPIAATTIALGSLDAVEDLKHLKLRGAASRPRIAELHHALAGVPAATAVYARAVGDAIVPIGDACQVQGFVPPPPVARPVVHDATGATIGVLSVIANPGQDHTVEQAVLRDDGHGVYGLAIGNRVFAAGGYELDFESTDCSGPPYMRRFGVLEPTVNPDYGTVFYGPAGPAAMVPLGSASVPGCLQNSPPWLELAVPAVPLDLDRFVPPFHIEHAPPAP